LGADPNADPSTWSWTELSASVYARDGVRITRGRRDEQSLAVPSTCNLTFDNRTGDFSPRNPLGAYYGTIGRNTPLRVRVRADPGDAYVTRFVGFVSEWPQRWNPRGSDFWVPIHADGVLRRLGQGSAPLKSALQRGTVGQSTTAAYWPLEDLETSVTSIPSSIPGVPNARQITTSPWPAVPSVVVTQWSANDTLPGSGALPSIALNTSVAGVQATVPVSAGPAYGMSLWTRTDVIDATSHDAETLAAMRLFASGGVAAWSLNITQFPPGHSAAPNGGVDVLIAALDEAGGVLGASTTQLDFTDAWRQLSATFETSGSDVVADIWLDGELIDTLTVTSVALGNVTGMRAVASTESSTTVPVVSFGHPTILSGTTSAIETAITALYEAGFGYVGEAAATRFARLCAEESIAADVTAGDTEAMGPQTTQTLMGLLRECEAAAEGLLVERLTGDLGFDPPSKRYNRSVDLTLDYDSGHIAPSLEPTDDDQLTRNDVTVTRAGSYATSIDQTGPLGVDHVGRYDETVGRNLASDEQLPSHSSWLLALGTVDELRWPRVSTNLRRNYTLVDAWLTCDIGSRIALTTLPDLVSYDPPDLFIEGYGEFMDPVTWNVELNCAPAEPYNIAEVEHATLSILGSDSATTAEALDTTETGVDITCGAGPDWTHETDFDIFVGGERMTVTAVAAMAATFPTRTTTLTVTRSVNGVVKSHSSGAAITFHRPAHIGL
jgi:hypothetical protein